jgi:hypothetical protein
MGLEFLVYLFGGIIYLVSPSFRRKTQLKWEKQSSMFKIYEIGMWVLTPFISFLLIVALLSKNGI